MRDLSKPLALSVRMSDSDYPGVVRVLSSDWRLSVSLDGSRYRLQTRVNRLSVDVWVCPPRLVAGSLSQLCDLASGLVASFDGALVGCPDDPFQALPELVRARSVQLALIASRRSSRRSVKRLPCKSL